MKRIAQLTDEEELERRSEALNIRRKVFLLSRGDFEEAILRHVHPLAPQLSESLLDELICGFLTYVFIDAVACDWRKVFERVTWTASSDTVLASCVKRLHRLLDDIGFHMLPSFCYEFTLEYETITIRCSAAPTHF